MRGAHDQLEVGQYGQKDIAKILRAVMHVRVEHGVESLGINRRRTGSKQSCLLDVHAVLMKFQDNKKEPEARSQEPE